MDSIYTPLTLAASLNKTHLIEYFILRGADVNYKDAYGHTPLMNAVSNWQFDSIKLLMKRGANPYIKDDYGYDSIDRANARGFL